jgi:CBS domain-containing protein
MRCEKIMKKDVQCLSQDATVTEAAQRMRAANVGFLPVCDSGGNVLGTLTDRDLTVRVLAEARDGSTKVTRVMSQEIVSCRPHDDLHIAEDLMARNHKSRILCLDDDGKLAGVISLSDIAQHERAGRIRDTLRKVSEREARA